MSGPEKIIETEILTFLHQVGIFAWKNDRQGTYDPTRKVFRKNHNKFKIQGVSDILCVIEGRFVAIEVKAPKGYLSQHQRIFLAKVNQEGGLGFMARSVEQVAVELSKHFSSNLRFRQIAERMI